MHDCRNLSDEELVNKALGDVEYFECLMNRYEGRLKSYVLRISSFSDLEAEEILQEVFLKVWKNLNGFTGAVKFSSWIYRIAHNETISTFRKAKSRGDDTKVEFEENLFIPVKTDFTKEFDKKITAKTIQKILEKMPDKYREVLILRFFEDKSYDEISDILKSPMGTVATMINRAKKSFREATTINDTKL